MAALKMFELGNISSGKVSEQDARITLVNGFFSACLPRVDRVLDVPVSHLSDDGKLIYPPTKLKVTCRVSKITTDEIEGCSPSAGSTISAPSTSKWTSATAREGPRPYADQLHPHPGHVGWCGMIRWFTRCRAPLVRGPCPPRAGILPQVRR